MENPQAQKRKPVPVISLHDGYLRVVLQNSVVVVEFQDETVDVFERRRETVDEIAT